MRIATGSTACRATARRAWQWLVALPVAAALVGFGPGPAGPAEAAGAQPPALPAEVPAEVQRDVAKLAGGEPFALNQLNMPFMAGIAKQLGESCGLSLKMEDRLELAGLVINGSSAMLGGNDYSNPDLGKTMGSMMGSVGMLVLGIEFARQIPCDSALAVEMADSLVAASRSNKGGGDAPFIPSCAVAFDEARCACLAQIGRGAIPDIYQRHYNRSIITELINRNPLLALTMSASCGIMNY